MDHSELADAILWLRQTIEVIERNQPRLTLADESAQWLAELKRKRQLLQRLESLEERSIPVDNGPSADQKSSLPASMSPRPPC